MKIQKAAGVVAEPVECEGAKGVRKRVLIGPGDGAPLFCMRQFTVAPGGHTPRHAHDWEHEVYVLSGRGKAVGADGERSVASGDCVFVPAGEVHQFLCTGAEALVFLCLVPNSASA